MRSSRPGAACSAHCEQPNICRDGLPGGSEWMVAGHYVFELSVRDAGWQIDAMTLHTYYQTGNRQLLEQAAQAR